jgi:hypothetical protein
MTDQSDLRRHPSHDRPTTNQYGFIRKPWRAPKVVSSEFDETEIDTGNAVDLGQPGDNRNHS